MFFFQFQIKNVSLHSNFLEVSATMKYHIQVFISVLLFAMSFVWSKQALEYLSPISLITFRLIVAGIVLVLFAKAMGKLQRLKAKDWMIFTLVALLEPVAYFLFENIGLSMVSPTLACLIIGLIPVLSPFAAHFINKEKISKWSYIGLFVSFSGVLLFSFSGGVESFEGRMEGILLLFGAVLTAVLYNIMIQRLTRRFNSMTIIGYINLLSLIFLVPLLFVVCGEELASLSFSWGWFYPVVALGVLCSSVAYSLNANGLRVLGVARTTIYINLMPGITAIASYFLMGEELSFIEIAGIIISIAGLFISNRRSS